MTRNESLSHKKPEILSAPGLWLGALTVVAALIRWFVARDEGLWRDEGLFLAIVRLPRWADTIQFLKFHESHPPLFYAMVRSWLRLAGNSDESALVFVLAIATLIVPVTYLVGERLYSRRVGAIAAVLAAISPILIDYSAMVRPYPLLQLLVLASASSLVIALQTARTKWWLVFGLSILAMLYTHNWAWLIAAGHAAAFVVYLLRRPNERTRLIVQGIVVAAVIALAFAPWAKALLYQSAHAGYAPLAVDVWHYLLILPFTLQATVLPPVGNSFQRLLATIGEMSFIFSLGLLWFTRRALKSNDELARPAAHTWNEASPISTMVFAVVVGTSLLLALLLSTRSNLIQPRCLSIFTPLGLIALAAAADHQWRTARHILGRVALLFGVVAILGVYGGGITKLLTTHKSNARELATSIAARSEPTDIIVLMPEWLASSFNHYFTPANEQIDYPREGREEAVDFANLMPRLRDPAALARVVSRVEKASKQGRRVWLISERLDTIPRLSRHPIDFAKPPDSLIVHIRLQQVRDTLISIYGVPDTTLARGKSRDRYEHLIAYLFTPSASAPVSGTPSK
jgi:uncharacterized membrane protein